MVGQFRSRQVYFGGYMFRFALLIVSLFSVVGCEVTKSATAPTPLAEAVSIEDVKIHAFEVGAVAPAINGFVSVGFSYHATATECVLFVFRGKTANPADLLGAMDVDVFQKKWNTAVLVRNVSGEHLVQLRCVHNTGAQTGAIEGRMITIP